MPTDELKKPVEIVSDRELARRVSNGERPHAVKLGEDRWEVRTRAAGEGE